MAHVDAEREAAGRATKSKKGLADSDLGKGLRLLIRAADCEQRSGACFRRPAPGVASATRTQGCFRCPAPGFWHPPSVLEPMTAMQPLPFHPFSHTLAGRRHQLHRRVAKLIRHVASMLGIDGMLGTRLGVDYLSVLRHHLLVPEYLQLAAADSVMGEGTTIGHAALPVTTGVL